MKATTIVLAAALALAAPAAAEGPKPIRGPMPIPETNASDTYRTVKHDRYIPRSHDWQPPVIPHHIKGYQITKNVNTCMTCHAKSAATRINARPIGDSHYVNRDGKTLPQVSTRRYFCLQCHVPQHDADPLVDNTFKGPK